MIINDVLVLGGSGFVGRHVCQRLVERGYRVTIPTRDRERAKDALIPLPTADVVNADVHDPDTLVGLMRGCGAVVNLVGVLHDGRGKASFQEAHVGLARKVVDACRRAGVQRLLHMSALNAAPDAPSEYLRSKGEAENIVRESGLAFTVFRPSVIFGREDHFLNLFARLQGALPAIALAMPEARFQPVYAEDVARVYAEAPMRLESIGQSFGLCGPRDYSLRALVSYVGELTGHRRPIIGLGPTLSHLQAAIMELSPVKLITRDNLRSMQVPSVCESEFPFGIVPTALEAVAPMYLAHRTPRDRYNLFRDRAQREVVTPQAVKVYEVGGAVRDELLGLPVKDRDYVVIGATPDEMIELGYRPVGRDFPVFLHPETNEEYALARTERKTGRGYHGFQFHAAPDVTLEEDLQRRDLTINAIARDENGEIIDPYNGTDDLSVGVLRHVSPAFAEDPVRILRVARFAARFGFEIAPETAELMREMVKSGEADALVPERVWQELARGLMEERPSRLFDVLKESGALERIAPELAVSLEGDESARETLDALDEAAGAGEPLEVRFAVLARALDPYAVDALANRLKLPSSVRDLAVLAARHTNSIADADALSPEATLDLLNASDAWRRPERFTELLHASLAGDPERGRAIRRLERAREAGAAVDAGTIAKAGGKGDIRERVNAARLEAIRKAVG